jgi:hypothetical protein
MNSLLALGLPVSPLPGVLTAADFFSGGERWRS